MTRAEWMMAISFLASCEADAAADREDLEEHHRFVALSNDAADMAGEDQDAAWDGMRKWIESRDRRVSEANRPPTVPRTYADLGI